MSYTRNLSLLWKLWPILSCYTSFTLDDTHGLDGGAQVCDTSGGMVHRPLGSSQRDQLGSNERETVVRGRHEDALVLHQEGGACATRIVGLVQSATFLFFSYLFFLSPPFFSPPPLPFSLFSSSSSSSSSLVLFLAGSSVLLAVASVCELD